MSNDCEDRLQSLGAIEQRLTGIESGQKELADSVQGINEKLFIGNGTPAMTIRLDRIEQVQERRKTNMILLWTTILGILVCIVSEHVFTWMEKQTQPQAAITAPTKL